MKYFLKTTFALLFVALIVLGCEDSFNSLVDERLEDNPAPEETTSGDSGSADFSNYVAIGNSLTAGFMDAALYNAGQQNSLPALLAEQFTYAGAPDEFNQPDINSELGFNQSVHPNPQNGTVLGRYKLDTNIPGPSPTLGGNEIGPYNGETGNLNNFGVPGILIGQLLTPATGGPTDPGDGSVNPAYNPFYQRFASNPSQDGMTGSTILGDAINAAPSFFTLWIGSNDVLGYAISGASNLGLLTSVTDFQDFFNNADGQSGVINQLMNGTTAKGVVLTIPPVTTVPFFRAIPYNAIELSAEEAAQLDASFEQGLNAILDQMVDAGMITQADAELRKVHYHSSEGPENEGNPILVNDPTLQDLGPMFDQLEQGGQISAAERAALAPYEQSRQLQAVEVQGQIQPELVTLSAGAVLGTEFNPASSQPTTIGVVIPLGFDSQASAFGDAYYLTLQEQGEINTRTGAFNQIIGQAVAQNPDRLALLDITAGFPGNPNTNLGVFADLFGYDSGQFAEEDLGIRVDGQLLQPDFSPNGVFSTDGIHPNQRGNAILANEIISIIESNFGASIPDIDVLDLPSVQVCAGNCVSQQQQKSLVGKVTYDANFAR